MRRVRFTGKHLNSPQFCNELIFLLNQLIVSSVDVENELELKSLGPPEQDIDDTGPVTINLCDLVGLSVASECTLFCSERSLVNC